MNYLSFLCRAVPRNILKVVPPLVRPLHILRPIEPIITTRNSILQPVTPTLVPVCGMKQKGRLRRRCKDCFFVVRQGRLYVMCHTKPRHKQMAMQKSEKNTWMLSHATMSPKRPW
nr:39S ribosomal protein L36, mitochondrial-like [Procambarus clarkii]